MLNDVVDDSLRTSRFNAFVLSTFGVVGLLLSALGIFSVFAFGVAARAREVGIRMAIRCDGAGHHSAVLVPRHRTDQCWNFRWNRSVDVLGPGDRVAAIWCRCDRRGELRCGGSDDGRDGASCELPAGAAVAAVRPGSRPSGVDWAEDHDMEIAIPKSLEALVRRKVEEGHYSTEDEIDALFASL